MATWTKKNHNARLEAQRRWREKQYQKKYREEHKKPDEQIHMDKFTYWNERRLDNLIKAGVVVPEHESEKQK